MASLPNVRSHLHASSNSITALDEKSTAEEHEDIRVLKFIIFGILGGALVASVLVNYLVFSLP